MQPFRLARESFCTTRLSVCGTTTVRERTPLRDLPQRCLLDGLKIHDRSAVVEHGAKLIVAGLGQVALRLEHEETRRGPGDELLLLGLEPLLGELTREAGGLDAPLVRDDLAGCVPYLS